MINRTPILLGLLLGAASAVAFEPNIYYGKQAGNCGVEPHDELQKSCIQIVQKRLSEAAKTYCANIGGATYRLGTAKETLRKVKALGAPAHEGRPVRERTIIVGEIEVECLSREIVQSEQEIHFIK